MNKFIKLTISAILVLLVAGAISSAVASPEVNLVARQDGGYDAPTPSPSTPADTDTPTGGLPKVTGLPKIPDGASPPDAPVDTGKVSAAPSATVPSGAGVPSGTGGLIPQWSSLLASSGAGPTSQPTAPPAYPSGTTAKAATTPASSAAYRIESGLISGSIIAGIVSLFF